MKVWFFFFFILFLYRLLLVIIYITIKYCYLLYVRVYACVLAGEIYHLISSVIFLVHLFLLQAKEKKSRWFYFCKFWSFSSTNPGLQGTKKWEDRNRFSSEPPSGFGFHLLSNHTVIDRTRQIFRLSQIYYFAPSLTDAYTRTGNK